MKFQRARTASQVADRQQEILNVGRCLYEKGGLDAVTFTAISEMTSFTRPAIYSYYKNRDDILLDILRIEVSEVNTAILDKLKSCDTLDTEDLALIMYDELSKHCLMLKMLSVNYSCIEYGCTMESLINFKRPFMESIKKIEVELKRLYPHACDERIRNFKYIYHAFVSSIYPVTHLTEKQKKAVNEIDPDYVPGSYESVCKEGLRLITSSLKECNCK